MTKQLIDMNEETKARLDSILFRGKTEDGKWIEGDFKRGINGNTLIGGHEFMPPSPLDPCGDTVYFLNEVLPETVGRFTGFFDAEGKIIWEDDIFRIDLSDSVVHYYVGFEDGTFVLYKKDGTKWGTLARMFELEDKFPFKLVGNFHDNPDLLK